ncbi:MAG: hypothetical protein WCB27_25325 [Thermoguttaceae bacterium]
MRTVALACALVMSLAPRGLAVPTAEDVRKIIADRCAKVGRFAMACEGVAAIVGSRGEAGGCWGYWGLDFAFERTTKRLSFECDGIPFLLVQDRRAFLLLEHDPENLEETPTYLEIQRDRAIAWKDITATLEAMKRESAPYGYDCCCCPYDACKDVAACVLAPFLEGGLDYFFSRKVQPLHYDAKSPSGDPESMELYLRHLKESEKLTEFESGIFTFGHPDSKVMSSATEKPPRLSLEQFPLCFKATDDSSSLVYAFSRENGVFLAVMGTADQERVFGSPGNKVTIFAKAYILMGFDKQIR